MIAKILGNPNKVDEMTVYGSRGFFARVCVELDVFKANQEKILVGWGDHSQTIEVINDKVPRYCTICKLLGHSLEVFFFSHNGFISRSRRENIMGKNHSLIILVSI